MSVRVSVVIPTYRRATLLRRCLTALHGQRYDPGAYEIIIADDSAETDTRAMVEAMAARSPVTLRYIAVSGRHGPAAARNHGWKAARGEIIAFTDDDTVPAPDWLAAGVAALHDNVVGAWGRIVVPLAGVPTDYERDIANLERAECATANCFYRRDALIAIGGFDERFTSAWREDSDVFFSLLEVNGLVVHAPRAIVAHPVRPAPWGVSLQTQRKTLFNALLYKKHPTLYRQRIQRVPWRYYAIVGLLAGAIAAAIHDMPLIAIAAATGWLLLTARFCAQRLRGTRRTPSHVAEMILTSALIPPLSIYWRLRGALKYRVLFI
jgi:glycosyltransferase involved in cell wall biosynthesis